MKAPLLLRLAGVSLLAALLPRPSTFAADEIDFEHARQLLQKQKQGQSLTAAEEAELARARAARRKGAAKDGAPAARPVIAPSGFGTAPLSERAANAAYKGESGGLYGDGRNEPPDAHRAAAMAAAKRIVPLDRDGRPSPPGKIVLLGVGMSNTTMEFRRFKQLADADGEKSPQVVVVDGAQGGQDAKITADSAAAFWGIMDERLQQAGVTASQVQAVWVKQAIARPDGEFPREAKRLQSYLQMIVQTIKARYPNTQLCYLSSRTYAGYATSVLNPEPHAFESAFAVRWLIQDQVNGAAALNFDPARGAVKAPVLLWGPYLWANGEKSRADGLSYQRADFSPNDGTHPSASGQQKVAELLLKFLKTDPTARGWYVGRP